MTSLSFHVPVAIILLGGGLLACFLGYRLLRTLLALYGFIAGVVVATLFVDGFETWVAILLTLGGGLLGSVVAVVAYLAGVAILGAGLGALALNGVYAGAEPNVWFVLVACIIGALMALAVRRYVLIMATSFAGAWTAIVGGLALSGNSAAVAAASGNLQQLPPVADVRMHVWFVAGWCGLGILAMLVQMRAMGRRRLRIRQAED
jgi:hypothetical protein